jgi:hypothetical protein
MAIPLSQEYASALDEIEDGLREYAEDHSHGDGDRQGQSRES